MRKSWVLLIVLPPEPYFFEQVCGCNWIWGKPSSNWSSLIESLHSSKTLIEKPSSKVNTHKFIMTKIQRLGILITNIIPTQISSSIPLLKVSRTITSKTKKVSQKKTWWHLHILKYMVIQTKASYENNDINNTYKD